MPIEDLNTTQAFALINETASVRYALDSADRLLRAGGPFERERDAIFAVCSIGSEKLVKVALCLIEVAEGRGWPSVQTLNKSRQGWGHAVAQMDVRLRGALAKRVVGLEREALLLRMLCTVAKDAVWLEVAGTMEAYATMGRFFHLDELAGAVPDPAHDPVARWEAAEEAAIAANPGLQHLRENDSWEAFEAALLIDVADSVRRWWSLIALMGMHGALGPDGKSFGADCLPDNAVPFRFAGGC